MFLVSKSCWLDAEGRLTHI